MDSSAGRAKAIKMSKSTACTAVTARFSSWKRQTFTKLTQLLRSGCNVTGSKTRKYIPVNSQQE